MGLDADLVKKDLINWNNESQSVEELFRNSSDVLVELGFAKESFFNAVNEREKVYPTGLELDLLTVAIPHTDVEHVLKPFIYVHKLSNSQLEFIQMGTDDVIVKPEFIFILGIKEPKGQVELLSSLIELFNTEEFVEQLKQCKTEEGVYELLKNKTIQIKG